MLADGNESSQPPTVAVAVSSDSPKGDKVGKLTPSSNSSASPLDPGKKKFNLLSGLAFKTADIVVGKRKQAKSDPQLAQGENENASPQQGQQINKPTGEMTPGWQRSSSQIGGASRQQGAEQARRVASWELFSKQQQGGAGTSSCGDSPPAVAAEHRDNINKHISGGNEDACSPPSSSPLSSSSKSLSSQTAEPSSSLAPSSAKKDKKEKKRRKTTKGADKPSSLEPIKSRSFTSSKEKLSLRSSKEKLSLNSSSSKEKVSLGSSSSSSKDKSLSSSKEKVATSSLASSPSSTNLREKVALTSSKDKVTTASGNKLPLFQQLASSSSRTLSKYNTISPGSSHLYLQQHHLQESLSPPSRSVTAPQLFIPSTQDASSQTSATSSTNDSLSSEQSFSAASRGRSMSLFQSKSAEGGASPPRRPKEGHSSAPAENAYLVRKEETTQEGGGACTEETNHSKKKHRVVQCRVVRAFSGSRADELHLVPGDTVMVTRRQASSHSLWWHGTCRGRTGVFPSNHVTLIAEESEEHENENEKRTEEASASADIAINEPSKKDGLEKGIVGEVIEEEGEIVYEDVEEESNTEGRVIKSGPLCKLIEALVIPRTIPEPHYTEAFLFTRPYFITSKGLLNRLLHVYLNYQGPSGDEQTDINKQQKPIQGRVLNVLQKWVEQCFYDFVDEPWLIETSLKFIADNIPTNLFAIKLAKTLRKKKREFRLHLEAHQEALVEGLFDQLLGSATALSTTMTAGSATAASVQCSLATNETTTTPREKRKSRPIIPSSISIKEKGKSKRGHRRTRSTESEDSTLISFLNISPKELAHNLTLIEQDMFSRVVPSELLFGASGKANKHEVAPHVMRLVEWFNRIVSWVASQIVLTAGLKERRLVLKRFIEIAQELRLLKNYFGSQEVISALNLACIERLSATWKGLGKQELALFQDLSLLMSRGQQNYAHYRQEFSNTEAPHLPCLGVHLSDLLALDQLPTWLPASSPSTVSDAENTVGTNTAEKSSTKAAPSVLNFGKMRRMEQAARPILAARLYPYTHILSAWPVHQYLTNHLTTLSLQQLSQYSKSCEPAKPT